MNHATTRYVEIEIYVGLPSTIIAHGRSMKVVLYKIGLMIIKLVLLMVVVILHNLGLSNLSITYQFSSLSKTLQCRGEQVNLVEVFHPNFRSPQFLIKGYVFSELCMEKSSLIISCWFFICLPHPFLAHLVMILSHILTSAFQELLLTCPNHLSF